MSETPSIGFIGLGLMGHGMAANLLGAGYPLMVRGNRNRAPVEDLLSRGAREAASPAEMAAQCDIIHLCLSNSPQVEAVIRGPGGILEGARPGLIVIDCTTADPVSTLALAQDLAARGAVLVDAPLGRTPKEAQAGQLDCMVGASPEVFDTVRPVIAAWARGITHVGPTGSGHKMKLLMNFLSMGYAALYSEALVLGARVGIAPATFREVLGPSRMGCGFMETFLSYVVDRNREAHKFTIANGAKDVRYINAMAADAQVMTVMAAAIGQYFTHAEATGHGGDFVPQLSDLVAALNGLSLAPGQLPPEG